MKTNNHSWARLKKNPPKVRNNEKEEIKSYQNKSVFSYLSMKSVFQRLESDHLLGNLENSTSIFVSSFQL